MSPPAPPRPTPADAPSAQRRRHVLWGLGAVVLGLHLLLLRQPLQSVAAAPEAWSGQALVTRSVVLAPQGAGDSAAHAAAARPATQARLKAPVEAPARSAPSAQLAARDAAVPGTEPAPVVSAQASVSATPADAATDPLPAGQASPSANAGATDFQEKTPSAQSASGDAATTLGANVPATGSARLQIPGSVRLRYDIRGEVKGLTYHASGDLRWRHDGQSYDARLEVGAFLLGSRVQTSVGQITEQGLLPRRFGDKTRSEVAAHFEYAKGQVIFSANIAPAELLPLSQDQLSIFVQLASLLAGQPSGYPPGSTLELPVASAREYGVWRWVVGETERLSLPGGDLEAVRISRGPRHPYDLNVEAWLAPKLAYLPARIRLTQSNGDLIDQLWRSSSVP